MNKCVVLTLCVGIALSGCFRTMVPVHSTWPVIPYPERPGIVLPDEIDTTNPQIEALIKSTYQYSRHIDMLEAMMDAYNREANTRNKRIEDLLFR